MGSINSNGILLLITIFTLIPMISSLFSQEYNTFLRPAAGISINATFGFFALISSELLLLFLILIGSAIGYFLSVYIIEVVHHYRFGNPKKPELPAGNHSDLQTGLKEKSSSAKAEREMQLQLPVQPATPLKKSRSSPKKGKKVASEVKTLIDIIEEGSVSEYLQQRREARRKAVLTRIEQQQKQKQQPQQK